MAISVTNLFFCTAIYNIRNYQVSDVNNEFSNNVYVTSRIVTIFLSQIIFLGYCLIFIGINHLSLIVFLYMLLITGESFSDVLQGIAQKNWRMDIIGISYILRGVSIFIAFIIFYKLLGLAPAIIGMIFLSFAVIIFYESRKVYKISAFSITLKYDKILKLLKTCFPLMLTSLLYVSFASIARIFLENTTNTETLGIFNSATMLSIIVMQASAFLYTPFVNILSDHFSKADFKSFNKIFLIICGIIIGFIFIGIVLVIFLGEYILSFLFGQSIIPYTYLLLEAMFVAGLTSFLWLLMLVLTIIRKLNIILIGCSAGFLACILSAKWSLNTYGISGANYMQIIGLGVSVLILLFAYVINIKSIKT